MPLKLHGAPVCKCMTRIAWTCVWYIVPFAAMLRANKKNENQQGKPSPYNKYTREVLKTRLDQEHVACERLEDKADRLASLLAGTNLVSATLAALATASDGAKSYAPGIIIAGLVTAAYVFSAWWLAMHSATTITRRYGVGTIFEATESIDSLADAVWKQEHQNRFLANFNCCAHAHFRNGLLVALAGAVCYSLNMSWFGRP